MSNRCPPFHFMLGHSALCAIRLLHCCPLCHSAIAHVCADRVGIPHGSRVGYKHFVSDVIIYSSYFHTNMFFCASVLINLTIWCSSPSRPERGFESPHTVPENRRTLPSAVAWALECRRRSAVVCSASACTYQCLVVAPGVKWTWMICRNVCL